MTRDPARPGPALLAEALAELARAAVRRRVRPFRSLTPRVLDRQQPACPPLVAEQVRRALEAWKVRLPFGPRCLVLGLAARRMLDRRGWAATLHYGAATIDGALVAHVWLTSHGTPVIGCDTAGQFAELTSFPPAAGFINGSPRAW